MYGMYGKECNISELKGKTIVAIRGMEKDSDHITFECSDGSQYYMHHEQDCCESVAIEDVCGNVDCLLNSPILRAEERTSRENPLDKYDESFTWTFYGLATVKGYVDIRWYGTSNGYYSESVSFTKIKEAYAERISEAVEVLRKHTQHYIPDDEKWAFNMALAALAEKESEGK